MLDDDRLITPTIPNAILAANRQREAELTADHAYFTLANGNSVARDVASIVVQASRSPVAAASTSARRRVAELGADELHWQSLVSLQHHQTSTSYRYVVSEDSTIDARHIVADIIADDCVNIALICS